MHISRMPEFMATENHEKLSQDNLSVAQASLIYNRRLTGMLTCSICYVATNCIAS
jgi:hypothetical protein